MKTVIDAVNEYKSEWKYKDSLSAYYRPLRTESYWYCGETKDIGEHVCTREEFNKCVGEMATNCGTSEAYSDYKVNFEMINDDMNPDIDWSNAPEGSTHWGQFKTHGHFYKSNGSTVDSWDTDCWGVTGWSPADLKDNRTGDVEFTPRPEVKPVTVPTFTDIDFGTTPAFKIGAKVTLIEDTKLYSCHYDVGYDLSAGDTVAVVGHGVRPDNDAPLITITNGKGFATLNPDYISLPIELIDGEMYKLTLSLRVFVGFYRESRNSFFTELTGGNKVCGKNEPNNIQLLEVTK